MDPSPALCCHSIWSEPHHRQTEEGLKIGRRHDKQRW
jgi:hypothetical protein